MATTDSAVASAQREVHAPQPVARTTVLLFAFTSFLSAFLLFQVQLIVSKHILPWFGGAAAVWTTSMLVFQLLLLGGYLYSHLVCVKLPVSAQLKVHLGLLCLAIAVVGALSILWPSAITPDASWKPLAWAHPSWNVAAIILVSAGVPFFVLSTTGPLLQSWFGRLGGDARTYRLYSVSNIGSLLGLLTFPFLIEPSLRVKTQGTVWSILFGAFVLACGLCARRAFAGSAFLEFSEAPLPDITGHRTGALAKLLWFLLAACASSLLLATTNLLCQEVITVPLLWVVPLAIYLITFVLCFDHPRWYRRAVFHPLFAVVLFVSCAALAYEQMPALLVTLPVLLFAGCMVCHGELVSLKPSIKELTSFYLLVSAGGATGGIFVGILAPRLFTTFLEFQLSLGATIVLLLAALAIDRESWLFSNKTWLPPTIAALAIAGAFGLAQWIPAIAAVFDHYRVYAIAILVATVTVLGAIVLRDSIDASKRGFRFVQIIIGSVAAGAVVFVFLSARPNPGLLSSHRSFYGVVQVVQRPGMKEMLHGLTTHGGQLDAPMQRMPILYYGPNSGIGLVLQNRHPRFVGSGLRIGVVGLGAGTIAAYGRRGDTVSYYEINPDVVKLSASDHADFTYIRDSAASVNVKVGDARLVMEHELVEGQYQNFDVLALDAFNGDAIPVHLLTREAFETYWKHLNAETGIIAIHITSRHVNLVPVLQGAANYLNVPYVLTLNHRQGPVLDSLWFLMARNPEMLKIDGLDQITIKYVHNVGPRLWTDDYSDIFRLLY